MKTGFITGVSGQDGSYLAELLVDRNYRVVGTTRNAGKASALLPPALASRVELIELDLRDQKSLRDAVAQYRPAEFYNCAAYSSGAGMYDDAAAMGEINGVAVTRMLEAIREVDINIRFCQASSSEMFGDASTSPQTEMAVFRPRSPYGAAKVYAHLMVQLYRKRYGIFSCSAILFNHESPRRGAGFVTRKVTQGAARIKLGLANELRLGNLEARRDWGYSGDYVLAMWMMLQQSSADDFVVATGETYSVRELCDVAFGHLGLDYRQFVLEDRTVHRPNESVPLVGDATKARQALNWSPRVQFRDLVKGMVDADMRLLQGDAR